MQTVGDVVQFLEDFAPARYAEEWDNVGLLVGDRQRDVARIMTCLTITETSAVEAIRQRADLIISHHPLPFRPLKQLTTDCREGRLLWQLMQAGVSIYSPHTAFDSAANGINARLADRLGLLNVEPLVARPETIGAGRCGAVSIATSLFDLTGQIKGMLGIERLQVVGDAARSVHRIGIACGSGGDFLLPAAQKNCDVLVTGEARFHACLEAESLGIALVLAGHYATERFGIEYLADRVAAQFTSAQVWASRDERDPIVYL